MLMWLGVVTSVVAWAWAWFVVGWPAVIMLLVALASVLFGYRAVRGMRLALVGQTVAGVAMLFGSIFLMYSTVFGGGAMTLVDWTAVLAPFVGAALLLFGTVAGFRQTRAAAPATPAPSTTS
jgi:hypothetical protein